MKKLYADKFATVLSSLVLMIGVGAVAVAEQGSIPEAYPDDYAEIVEASKDEDGLLIYSNMAEYNWAPVVEGFNELYPWIEVQTLDLGSAEVFTRYNVEAGSDARTADLLATGSIEGWMNFMESGAVMDYTSAEDANVPEWSNPAPGVYTVSTDPMVLAYNKATVPEPDWPKSLADIAALVENQPGEYENALTTYNGLSPFGEPIHWQWLQHNGDKGWESFSKYGPSTVPEESAGTMVSKLTSGEYKVGYFLSGIVVFPKTEGAASRVLGWSFPEDGTPLVMRSVAVTEKSTNVNSAKLMLDFIVSQAGQTAFGEGGLTPYHSDVQAGDRVKYTYDSIVAEVGEDNIVLVDYDEAYLEGKADFEERWKEIVGE